MKKNNLTKAILAMALASAVFAPSVKKSFATDTFYSDYLYESSYLESRRELYKTISDAKEIKNKDRYINASTSVKDSFNVWFKYAEDAYKQAPEYSSLSSEKDKLTRATQYLKEAMKALDGKKSSITDLKDLLDKHTDFTTSSSYLYATQKQKDAYLDAYNKAYRYYYYETYNTVLSEYYTKELKEKRAAIENAYLNERKKVVKDEIDLSEPFRKNSEKYTKKSFDTFLSALKLAETSVEDKSNIKTEAEYKQIAATLKSAREALVEVKVKNEELEKYIEKLQTAVDNNKIAVKSGETLLEIAPKQVAPVKGKLINLIKNAKSVIEKSEAVLAKLKGIKG
ncbi:hypothetical protein HMPREF0072_1549 [Anaerococcus lactolyticus ATCC 51172]|uniref:Uncharacterized protein n=1 Tax=Anaerococcus lactolyticus ATCC 51172 TaxID=525254 RepID=C2BGS9_9FIRM|nr:hypothetical protein [Anaerococcus lactolyticus]EEI85925.1 hypothetical protein HMPREF0072_1549 [Anaerococcus lactolyticus ATCC 51172]